MQPSNTELILIRVTGEDRPGLTASVTEILAKYDATILDIGQADIHNTLSLGILFKSEERHSGFIMKELLFKASSLGVTIRFEPITTEQYDNWVGMQGKNRYILTVLGRKLSARQISAATSILAEQGMNIDAIKRLTGRIPLDECQADTRTRACIEFSVRGTPKDRIAMQEKLMKLASELEMDFSFQQDNMYRRMRRLICFDMDSTLIETEVIDELAIRAGVGDEVKAITESAAWRNRLYRELYPSRSLIEGVRRIGNAGNSRELAYHRGCRATDVCIEEVRLQDRHPFGRIHLFRPVPAKEIRYRLCLCQRTGNHRRQTNRTLSGGCSRRKTESRTAPPHCTSGKGGYCTDHRRRRRSQRSPYAGGCRTRNRLPRQAQSSGQCQAINQHYRTGWSALFPRVQRFLLEYVIRPKNRLSLLTNKIKE